MAYKPEWQSTAEGPPRRRGRWHTWPSVVPDRPVFKMRIQRWMVPMWWNVERRRATDAAWDVRGWPSLFFFQGKSIKTVAWLPALPDHAAVGTQWLVGTWPAATRPLRHPLASPGLPSSTATAWTGEAIYVAELRRRRRGWELAAMRSVFQRVEKGEKTPSLDPEV